MRSFVLLSVLLAAVYAADSNIAYAGTTSGSPTFMPPSYATVGTCAVSTTAAPYVTFTFNVTTAGLRSVQIMAEDAFKSNVNVWFYTAFNPTASCTGLYVNRDLKKLSSLSGGPPINDVVNFAVGTYVAVLSSTSGASGIFAIHIDIPELSGAISGASPVFPAGTFPYVSSSVCTNYVYSYDVPYVRFWKQITQTGDYDVIAAFVNDTLTNPTLYLNIYEGMPSAVQLANDTTSCGNNATFWWIGGVYYTSTLVGSYGITLTAGKNYTFVISTDQADGLGSVGVVVQGSQVRSVNTVAPAFDQPARSGDCASAGTTSSWYALQFTAVGQVYVIDTAAPSSGSVDTYSFLYYGNNAGLPGVVAPVTCPLGANSLVVSGDTGDITPVFGFTTPSFNYTVVVSTFSSSSEVAGDFILYTFTGNPIGNIPSTTGTATGTGTGATATGTGSVTTGATTGNSGAASVSAAFGLIFAIFALLL
jgi:hypothetical protein